ncbi:hypothetical protein PV797_17845 [Clostridiaceae bacterium M8S5]|nr:hypothetical protein PV797_17845 [Clostridiaceae bacterium M8S5]
MAWCPKCKIEFRDDSDICSYCKAKLVSELKSDTDKRNLNKGNSDEKNTFLMNVLDDIEAGAIESLLNSYGIPTLRKYKSTGEYTNIYMGRSVSGVDLYVPLKLYEEAKIIITKEKEDISDLDDDDCEYYKQQKRKRSIMRLCFISLLLIPTIIILVTIVKQLL